MGSGGASPWRVTKNTSHLTEMLDVDRKNGLTQGKEAKWVNVTARTAERLRSESDGVSVLFNQVQAGKVMAKGFIC